MTRRGPTGSRRPKKHGAAPAKPPDWRAEDPNLELEKLRYADPIASRELLLKHLSEAPEPLTAARLAKRLGLHTDAQRDALSKRLAAMVRDGQAIEGPNGFATAGDGERVAGRVRGRANGEVLVLPDDGSAPLVLARADTATLMHNDRVEVLAVGVNERGRRIARLIRRTGDAPTRIGGVWHAGHGGGSGTRRAGGSRPLVFGRSAAKSCARRRGRRQRHRRNHQAAAGRGARARPHRRGARGRAAVGSLRRASRSCATICRRNFRPRCCMRRIVFEPDVRPADRAGREDLRELPLVTIDGEDAKDFDDAVYAEALRGGGWRLVVAIADVSHYVRVGSALDVEARARATSVYFPDRVLPMLPEHLSNHLCSLMPHVERLAFVCDMRVSKTGKPGRTRFYEAVIRSHARLTYDQAWNYLRGPAGDGAGDDFTPSRCAHRCRNCTPCTAL